MSKRTRPLSGYAWEPHSSSKRARSENEEEEEEEEETMHIDESAQAPKVTPQQHGMAILNSMAIDKQSLPKPSRMAVTNVEEVPTVYLDQHYSSLYNRYMNMRFPPQEQSDSSEIDEEGDLFASLARSTTSTESSTSSARRKAIVPYDTEEREECFLCSYNNKNYDGIKEKHVKLLFEILSKYGYCNNKDLSLMLHRYYKKHVYRPNQDMPMLTKEIALEHIEGLHSLAPILFLGEAIRKCQKIMFGFENAIFRADGKYDKEASNQFKDYVKLICMLRKMDPQLMLFNADGATKEDLANLGRLMSLLPQSKERKERHKRAKRTEQITLTNETFGRGFET